MARSLARGIAGCGLIYVAFVTASGCTVNSTKVDPAGGTPDAGGSGQDAAPNGRGFTPSNIDLSGVDLSMVGDADIATNCAINTGTDAPGGSCLTLQDASGRSGVETVLMQSDGSKVHVFVVKSLTVEPAGHITINGPAGGLPVVIVSLGDMTVLGTIDVSAKHDQSFGGGFQSSQISQKGAGPGGGPAATGTGGMLGAGAGGGSYCGKGGQGALESGATLTAGAAAAPVGTVELVPLVGGSSGGSGTFGAGAGGGALQLVAFGQFSAGAGSTINVGGGGGEPAVSSNPGDNSGGGGSGGALLIEATAVKIAGTLAANGGGGGGVSNVGLDATPDATPAPGGGKPADGAGGAGSAGTSIDGATPASVNPGPVGGGGGGAGRIRINTTSGAAVLSAATLSPAASTTCVTQGKVKP